MPFNDIFELLKTQPKKSIKLMEVCGTHTMSIAKAGIKQLLPEGIKLLSGPGCPVCVTPENEIDAILDLSSKKSVIITSYGDMLRVPGSKRGDSLAYRRSGGADVRVVYSPLDAINIADDNPDCEVVFLGVGFETTAPGTAAAILEAKSRNSKNFSVFTMLRLIEPAMRALIESDDFNIDGFICPGHVAVIIGSEGFRFIPKDYNLPAVVAGFDRNELISSIETLVKMCIAEKPDLINEYKRTVSKNGNELALAAINEVFMSDTCSWRGLGDIENSGLAIRPEFRQYDAASKFEITKKKIGSKTACSCGDIIRGKKEPVDCSLFAKQCTPENPVGPCMVSSEGACAAFYKYSNF